MRVRGTDRTAFLDNRQFHGNAFALKMAEPVAASGLPWPEVENDGGCVTVRFRHAVDHRHLPNGRHGPHYDPAA